MNSLRRVGVIGSILVILIVVQPAPATNSVLAQAMSVVIDGAAVPAANSADPPHTYENPQGGCRAAEHDLLELTALPNHGALWPEAVVTQGETVQLIATAEHQQRDADCATAFTSLDVTWRLLHEDEEGVLTDVTAEVNGTDFLTPTFTAQAAGYYRVMLVDETATLTSEVSVQVLAPGVNWRNIGPDGTGPSTYLTSGRVNALAFDPRPAQSGTIYAGTPAGGVWKSNDDGASWRPTMDNKGLPTMAINALAVGQDGTVYAGTGDANKLDSRPGQGIWVSHDGGATWGHFGGSNLGDPIRRILVDGSGTVFAATQNGLWRYGGTPATWTNIAPSDIYFDIAFEPGSPARLYALTASGVYVTAGAPEPAPQWTWLTWPWRGGMGCSLPSRGGLALSPENPQVVYAGFVCASNRVVVQRSADRGTTWGTLPPLPWADQSWYNLAIASDPNDANVVFVGNVPLWRFDVLNRNPGAYCRNSTPVTGPCWTDWSGPGSRTPFATGADIHGDVHALLFDPILNFRLYAGTDGGVHRYDLAAPTRGSWRTLNTNLAIGQFLTLGFNPNWPGDVAGGLQDNATLRREYAGTRTWAQVPGSGGDGKYATYDARLPTLMGVPAPFLTGFSTLYYNPQYFYANRDQINRVVSEAAPMANLGLIGEHWIDPYRPGTMLATEPPTARTPTGQLYVATNAASATGTLNWSCIDPTPGNTGDKVTALAMANGNPAGTGAYYVGFDNGQIRYIEVLSPLANFPNCSFGSALNQNQRIFASTILTAPVRGLVEDPNRPCVLYAVMPAAADVRYRVMQITGVASGGRCRGPWANFWIAGRPAGVTGEATIGALPTMSNGQLFSLQDHAIAVDPTLANTLYLGTNAGMFMSQFDGTNWLWTRVTSVPEAPVTDIKAQVGAFGALGTLFAATYGRGVYERLNVAAPVAITSKPAAEENAITRCQAHDTLDGYHEQVVLIEVDYQRGTDGHGAQLRPILLTGGEEAHHFVRETHPVELGTRTVLLQIAYDAHGAPPALTTDRLRVEMVGEVGEVLAAAECHFHKVWRRPDAQLLTVRAEDVAGEGGHSEIPVEVMMTVGAHTPTSYVTPFTVGVAEGSTVTLAAPTARLRDEETRSFHLWLHEGHGIAGDAATLTLLVTEDTVVMARYVGHEQEHEEEEESLFVPRVENQD